MKAQRIQLRQLSVVIWATFLLVGASTFYWGVLRGNELAERDDNPRVVEDALRVQRGTIFDINDHVLAFTDGPANRVVRVYPMPNIGPAVGYYSFRHGESGIEAGMSAVLSGADEGNRERVVRDLLHQPQVGRDVRLTLNSEWQMVADELLAGQRGAFVVLSVPDGAIRVMASHPGFNPNRLDEQFDTLTEDAAAPLLNRATQGLYQPGLVLQPLLYAAVHEQGRLTLTDSIEHMSDPVELVDQVIECEGDPNGGVTWGESLQARCPAPLLTFVDIWSADELTQILAAFGLLTPPDLPLATESADVVAVADLERELLGQGELTVSPLQIAIAYGSLVNDGRLLRPFLVSSVQGEDGEWELALDTFQTGLTAVAAPSAQTIFNALPLNEGIIEHHVFALAGPGGSQNSWYVGMAPAGAPQIVIAVVIEDVAGEPIAEQIGQAFLREILFE